MIPSETVHVFPIVPQHVAALLFSVDQQDERPSHISLNISHPLSLCVLLPRFFKEAVHINRFSANFLNIHNCCYIAACFPKY